MNQGRYNVLEESLQVYVHESRTLQCAGYDLEKCTQDVCGKFLESWSREDAMSIEMADRDIQQRPLALELLNIPVQLPLN